jgi:uncharacterized protein (DUF2267 family)
MSATGLEVFDKTLQTTHIWLDQIMERIGPDRHTAWRVLGVVLRALRDRLPPELAVHFGAQLPLLIRGAYYDQWRLGSGMDRTRSGEVFLKHLSEDLAGGRPVGAEDAALAVLGVVVRHVTPGQLANVRDALPAELRALLDKSQASLAS